MLLVQRMGRQGCAGRRIIRPCRNGASMPTIPCPASMPAIPCPACIIHFPGLHPGLICVFPGLHPGLVCVAPLGQMGPGAFSRWCWRWCWRRSWKRWQRWARHVTSRGVMITCRRLRPGVAEGAADFWERTGCRGGGFAASLRFLRQPAGQPRLSRSCWVRATSVSRLSSAHMSRALSRRSAAWAVSPAVAVAAPMSSSGRA